MIRKLMLSLLLVLLFFSCTESGGKSNSSTPTPTYDDTVYTSSDGYDYQVTAEGIRLTDFNGTQTDPMTIPSQIDGKNVGIIAEELFYNSTFTSLIVPEPIHTIDTLAFESCLNLQTVSIPKSVRSIGNQAFINSNALTAINVDSDNSYYTSVDGILFTKNMSEIVTYPSGKTDVTYNVPTGVKAIGKCAFQGSQAQEVNLPAGIEELGLLAFSSSSIIDFEIPEGITETSPGLFASSDLETLILPSTLKTFGNHTFRNCSEIISITVNAANPYYLSDNGVLFSKDKSLLILYPSGKSDLRYTLPAEVTHIGTSAFYESSLEGIQFNAVLTNIDSSAFSNSSLKTITLPEGLQVIENYVFEKCTELTSIVLPSSITTLNLGIFYQCSALETIEFLSSTPPGISNGTFFMDPYSSGNFYSALQSIIVPDSAAETLYKAADIWEDYESYIEAK